MTMKIWRRRAPVVRALLLVSIAVLSSCCFIVEGVTVLFENCDVDEYYGPISSKLGDRESLHGLIKDTHQRVLPYTSSSGKDDVWRAVTSLDRSDENPSEVQLVYAAQKTMPALPHGTSTTWNREHVWPKSLGVGTSGPDYTDVHHLRASDWNVNAARGNKYFGTCGVVDVPEDCRSPAHSQAAADTETDNVIWSPPAHIRGDLARMLFYMDVRYEADNGLDLTLSDCPSGENEMGYLSQLLEWHMADPVDDWERRRNGEVCSQWQGNRNPFIDFPELVQTYFGSPAPLLGSGLGYNCTVPRDTNNTNSDDSSPTQSPVTGSSCAIPTGSIMVVAVTSDNPDTVALVALEDLLEGASFYMTDNGWTGTEFRTNEGTLKFTIPMGGIAASTVFGYVDGDSLSSSNYMYSDIWEPMGGSFALAASGDSIFIYCQSDDDPSVVHHVSAFSYTDGTWKANNGESLENSESVQPPSGVPAVALPHKDNYVYIGPRSGTREEWLSNLAFPSYWKGSNDALPSTIDSNTILRVLRVTDLKRNTSGACFITMPSFQMYLATTFLFMVVLTFLMQLQ